MSREVNFPQSKTLELLAGKISEPISLGDNASVRLVEEGSGMAGLTHHPDNINWSGIFHHLMFSTRIAHHLATRLADQAYPIDPNVVLQSGIDSHLGRRIWDEAKAHPTLVKDSAQKLATTNEAIGLDILRKAGTDPAIYQTVAALAHGVEEDPAWRETLEYKIFSYVDHRATDKVYSYGERMGNFLVGNFFLKDQVTQEKKQLVSQMIEDIFQSTKQGQQLELKEIVSRANALGAANTSDRLRLDSFMTLILEDARTESLLEKAGIDVNNLNDIPAPRWERYLRRLYLMDAEKEVFKAKEELNEAGFDSARWGTGAFNQLYKQQEGKPYESKNQNPERQGHLHGWVRAIWFFQYLVRNSEQK